MEKWKVSKVSSIQNPCDIPLSMIHTDCLLQSLNFLQALHNWKVKYSKNHVKSCKVKQNPLKSLMQTNSPGFWSLLRYLVQYLVRYCSIEVRNSPTITISKAIVVSPTGSCLVQGPPTQAAQSSDVWKFISPVLKTSKRSGN